MPSSVSRHDAQTVTTFTFKPVNQTARFFVSEFGCFTTAIAEHGPILILKIARHFRRLFPSPSGRGLG
jgi:branched-subunit amino acid aminotransferase/4-amino-4-deoxychorismate lyase